MAETPKLVRTLIGWSYDRASEAAVLQGISRVNGALQSQTAIQGQIQTIDAKPLIGMVNYAKSVGIMEGQVESATADIKTMSSELLTLEENARKASESVKGVGAGGVKAAPFPTFTDEELAPAGPKRGGLSRLGSNIRSLPSTPIPGTGIATDAIGNMLRIFGVIPGLTLPIIGAFAGLAAGLVVVNKLVPEFTGGIREITALDKKYYEQRITGTRESINSIIEEATLNQKIAQARLDDLQFVAQGYDVIKEKAGGALGGVLIGITEIAGAAGAANFKDIRDARIAYDEAQEELKKANKELDLYNGLLDDNATALNTAAEAQKAATQKGIESRIDETEQTARIQSDINKLIREGSQEELEAKRQAVADDKERYLNQANLVGELLASAKEGSEAQRQYQEEFTRLSGLYNQASDELILLGDSALEAAVKLNDANKEAEKIRDEQAERTIKFNQDIAELNEKLYEDQIAAAQAYADKQIDIANKAVEESEEALQKLLDKQSSLALDLSRAFETQQDKANFDALQDQIDFQRKEVDADKKHQANLLKIQKDSDEKAFELGLDRQFAQLAALKRQTASRLSEANQEAQDARAERLQRFQEESDDQQAQFAFDREMKIKKYQQDLDDAKAAEQKQQQQIQIEKEKQLAAARAAYVREMNDLQTKYNNQQTLLRSSIQTDLQTIAEGEAGKNKLLKEAYEQAKQIIKGIFDLGTGSGGSGGGGSTSNQIIGGFSTPTSESFRPGFGYGSFAPALAGGSGATYNSQSVNFNMNNSLQAGTEERLVNKLSEMVEDRLAYVISQLSKKR